MSKKRRGKKMGATAKVINFIPISNKSLKKKTITKKISETKMSDESIKSSYDFKRRSWERD